MATSQAADGANAPLVPLMIQQQGSFAVGGTVIRSAGTYDPDRPGPEGQTLHGDHARVFYQVPESIMRSAAVLPARATLLARVGAKVS